MTRVWELMWRVGILVGVDAAIFELKFSNFQTLVSDFLADVCAGMPLEEDSKACRLV